MTIIFILILVGLRFVECYVFLKKVSKACHKYDWKYVNSHDILLLEMLEDKYYLTSEWSAYNFLYLKGPNPLSLFFSCKPFTIEDQYNEYAVKRLVEYEVI